MPKTSAGLLLFRYRNDVPEVLLVHPGGPFWANRHEGVWSVPKGEYDAGTEDSVEEPLECARREFREELGSEPPSGELLALGEVTQKAGKRVTAFAIEGDLDPSTVVSNTFEMEWPPSTGRISEFPEIDEARWFDLPEARIAINEAQATFIDRLETCLPDRKP